MLFSYHCVDKDGKFYEGVIHEESADGARLNLESKGWQVLRLETSEKKTRSKRKRKREREKTTASPGSPQRSARRELKEEPPPDLPRSQLRIFTTQMAAMLDAGVPLLRILEAVADTGEGQTEKVAGKLHQLISQGHQLSQAMHKMPGTFGSSYVTLVEASEQSGQLAKGFDSLSHRLEREEDLRNRLWQALTYPMVVTVVATAMLAFLLYYMFPRFATVFIESGTELPWLTRMVIGASHHSLPFFLAAVVGLELLFFWTRDSGSRHNTVRSYLLFETPWLGTLNRQLGLSEMSRDLAISLDAGIPLGDALGYLARQQRSDLKLKKALRAVFEEVKDGSSLSEAMEREEVFPPLMVTGAAVGMETGTLPFWFAQTAKNLELEIQLRTDTLADLLEPLILGFLGIGVAVVVLAAFLPIYQMVTVNL